MQETLMKEIKENAKTIENEVSWFKIYTLFEKLVKLEDKNMYTIVFPIISDLLVRSIQSDRSRLNGIALDFLKISAIHCHKEHSFAQMLPLLFKISGRANKVFVSRALDAIIVIAEYIELKSIQKYAVEYIENTNKNVRFAAYTLIKLKFNLAPEYFKTLIEKGAKDPAQEVRNLCKDVSVQKAVVEKTYFEAKKNAILSLTPRKNFKVDKEHAEVKKLEAEMLKITKEPVIQRKPLNASFFEKLNQIKKERATDKQPVEDELTPRKLDKYLEKYRTTASLNFTNNRTNTKAPVFSDTKECKEINTEEEKQNDSDNKNVHISELQCDNVMVPIEKLENKIPEDNGFSEYLNNTDNIIKNEEILEQTNITSLDKDVKISDITNTTVVLNMPYEHDIKKDIVENLNNDDQVYINTDCSPIEQQANNLKIVNTVDERSNVNDVCNLVADNDMIQSSNTVISSQTNIEIYEKCNDNPFIETFEDRNAINAINSSFRVLNMNDFRNQSNLQTINSQIFGKNIEAQMNESLVTQSISENTDDRRLWKPTDNCNINVEQNIATHLLQDMNIVKQVKNIQEEKHEYIKETENIGRTTNENLCDLSILHNVAGEDLINQAIVTDNIDDIGMIEEYNNTLIFNDNIAIRSRLSSFIENTKVDELSKSFASITIEPSNINIDATQDCSMKTSKIQKDHIAENNQIVNILEDIKDCADSVSNVLNTEEVVNTNGCISFVNTQSINKGIGKHELLTNANNAIFDDIQELKPDNECINCDKTVVLSKHESFLDIESDFSFIVQPRIDDNNKDSPLTENIMILDGINNKTVCIETEKKISTVSLFNEDIFESENEDVSRKSFVMSEKPSFKYEQEQ